MATGRNQRDVALVIKARDEATKTFDAVADALQNLVTSQGDLASGAAGAQNRLTQFANILLDLDKAAAGISSKFDTAAEAVERMQQRAASNSTRFDELTREAQSLTRVVELLSAEADKAFVGPRRNGLTESLRAAKGDLTTLNREIASLGASISRDLEGIGGATSPLQQLASTERAVGDAAAQAAAQIELQKQALRDLEQQAQSLTPIQSRINAVTGVSRPDATGSAAAAADVLALADAEYRVTEARNAEIQKLKQQEAATASLAREQEAQQKAAAFFITGNLSGKSARDSASVFAEAEADALKQAADAHKAFEDRVKQGAAAMREEDLAVARLRAELDPLATITARAAVEQKKLDDWQKRGIITDKEAAQAKKLLAQSTKDALDAEKNGALNKPRVSLFGLRPYETQNLLFQVNDIVTQLGSGASLGQTLAQQGGQIFQLFQNRIGPSIAAAFSNPYFLAAGTVLAAFVVGLKEAGDQLERMRTFSGDLAANADGAFYDPRALEASTKALDQYGLSAAEAVKAVRAFARDGVAPDQIVAFGKAAKDLSDVMGSDLDTAVKQVSESFTRGFEAVDKLDQSLNFLTASERERIQTLFEEGRAGEARTEALRIFSDRMEEAAQKSRGSWADAVRSLGNAWSDFKALLADTSFIKDVTLALNTLGAEISNVIDRLRGIRNVNTIMREIAENEAILKNLQENPGFDIFGIGARRIKAIKEELARLRAELERVRATEGQGGSGTATDTVNQNSEAQRKADQRIKEAADRRLAQEKQISNEKRIQLAIDKAAREAADAGASQAGINQAKETAAAEERAKIAKEEATAARTAASERERAINQFNSRVIGAEGGSADNPFSSASGFGQFTKSTWLDQFRKVFGDQADQLTQQQILALRQNQTVAKAIIDNYARENAKFLEGFGAKVTAGNLYLAHFLGAAGAKRVLTADPNTSTYDLFKNDPGVLSGNQAYFRKNGGKGNYRTAGELRDFIAGRVGDTGAAQSAGEVEISKILEENKQRQEDFNAAVQKGNQDRQESIDGLKAEQGLIGEALIAAQRKAAVDKAEADLRQKVAEQNRNLKPGETEVVLTQEQIDKTRELTAAQFDLAHAKDIANARRAAVDDPVRDLTAQRDAIQQQIKFLSEQGNTSAAAALGPQLADVNTRLDAAIEKAKAFYAALANNPQALAALGLTKEAVENIRLGLENTQVQSQSLGYFMGLSLDTVAQQISGGVANAFDRFAQSVAQGKNVFKSLKEAFLQFASDFLRQIAQMIIQQTIFNLVSGIIKSATGAGVGANHSGGMPGGSGLVRGGISPMAFAGAMRLHTGGVPGLKSNEVPTILERDEEVLTRSDPRHILNGGKNAKAAAAPIVKVEPKIINTIDPGEVMSQAMNTRVGQQAFLNFMSQNQDAVKSSMG